MNEIDKKPSPPSPAVVKQETERKELPVKAGEKSELKKAIEPAEKSAAKGKLDKTAVGAPIPKTAKAPTEKKISDKAKLETKKSM